MRILKKISLAVATVAVLSTSSFAGQVLVGGNVALINSLTGIGVTTLDLSSAQTEINIATFIVNNNSTSFTVQWTLLNGGSFVKGTGATALQIPMTTCVLAAGGSGTYGGTGAPAFATVTPRSYTGTPATDRNAFTPWTVTNTVSATSNYVVLMNASWAASSVLAGLYTETIEYTITATM